MPVDVATFLATPARRRPGFSAVMGRAGTSWGGITSFGDSSTFTTVANTIVSGNVISGTTTADDLAIIGGFTNSFSSGGYNLIGAIGSNITFDGTGDQIGVSDPHLGVLADNGGGTFTHALLPGSLAIDNGECSSGPAADQRGVARPQNDSCDIGAYEGSCAMTVMNNQSSGLGSLRETIAGVCDGGLISFDNGLAGSTIDISPDGELLINKSVTISGTVPITVSGNNAVRVFNVTSGNVIFDSLIIANGDVPTADCGGGVGFKCGGGIRLQNSGVVVTVINSTLSGNSTVSGGGIYNLGSVTVSNSSLSGNSATRGGGIYNSGTLTVSNSTLSDNSAEDEGGGIVNHYSSSLTVNKSSISGNSADWGGGIYNLSTVAVSNSSLSGNSADDGGGINSNGTMTLSNSTLSGNRATDDGGGIHNNSRVTVNNSTLSGNSALDKGGGIYSEGNLSVSNSTLSDNSASIGGGIYNSGFIVTVNNSTLTENRAGESGGGISSFSGDDTLNSITSTIVSGNIISGTTRPDDLASSSSTSRFKSGGYNLIGAVGVNIIFNSTGDQTSIYDPELDPLADNGGESMTHALLPGSPALDAGGDCGVATDQRGFARPQGSACDTGAFEVQFPTLTVLLAGAGSGSVSSLPSGINCFDGAGSVCAEDYWEGTAVTLTATAAADSSFTGWSGGGCSGSGDCVLTMDGAKTVTASFAVTEFTVSLPVVIR